MAYSDILNTTSLYGNLLNKDWANAGNNLNPAQFNDLSIDPNSSGAFTPRSSRNIYNRPMEVSSKMDAFSDYDPWSLEGGTMQVMQGLQYGGVGKELSPYIQDLGKGLSNTLQGNEWGAELTGKYGEMGGLGPAATVYGLTQDQNPYETTQTEHLGTMATTVMAAKSLAPLAGLGAATATNAAALAAGTATTATYAAGTVAPVLGMNPYVLVAALLLGNWFGNKKKDNSKKLQTEAIEEFEGKQDDIYADRSKAVEDMRGEMLSEQQSNMYEQRQGRYDNQYGGNYSDYRGEEGMKFSPKELKKIASAGRFGDTQLAHINPQEAQMLKEMGSSGTINPYTGLPEHHWKLSVSHMLKHGAGAASDLVSTAGGVATDILEPVFDAAGNLIEPILEGAGNVANELGENVFTPAVEGIASGLNYGVTEGMDLIKRGVEPILGVGLDAMIGLSNLFKNSYGEEENSPYTEEGVKPDINRDAIEKDNKLSQPKLSGLKQNKPSGLTKKNKPTLAQGDWVGAKPNPFITANVEEEIDYANKGMKYKYDKGGKANIVAEFTGNELIVNDQDAVENALANKNYSKAANSIRNAMQKNQLTPGPETHGGNPMPVDDKGNIYASGGSLPFKVSKGAGIYDHATDQFNPTMTDKEISMVAQNNINKWKSNNMYA